MCLYQLDLDLHNVCVRDKICELVGGAHVMTFMSNMKPFDQVLRLWDYYMTHGFHLNILAIVALLFLMRPTLLAGSKDGWKFIRESKLDAASIIAVVERVKGRISVSLMELLKAHLYDPASFKLISNFQGHLINDETDDFSPR